MKTQSASHSRRSLLGPLLSGCGASPAPLIHIDDGGTHGDQH
jgi:hypothetical protein